MKRRRAIGVALLALGLAATTTAQKRNITLKGSDTMVLLGQRWAETYMKRFEGVAIQVTGGGSGTGIAALVNGTTDIAEASRAMKPKEVEAVKQQRGKETVEVPVAVDGLAVYLNEQNPVKALTLEQIKGIYTGAITNWKQVGGTDGRIILYGRENNSGTYVYFKEEVLQNADYHPMTQTLPGTAAVINAVSKDARGIGYGGIAYAKGVKHAQVKKDSASEPVDPTMENVLSGTYPISRPLYWYFAGQPDGDIREFALWVLSDEGQKVVEAVGYYPLKDADRKASLAKLSGKSSEF
jgi:phosphate transport system substrate-binding protein